MRALDDEPWRIRFVCSRLAAAAAAAAAMYRRELRNCIIWVLTSRRALAQYSGGGNGVFSVCVLILQAHNKR